MAYASKYYDPVKAHEYYERTKELKGYADRYGGSRGNGTSAASGGITNADSSASSSNTKTSSNKTITPTQKHNLEIRSKIQNLRDQLKNMSKDDRKANRESIQDQIQALREQTKGGSTSGFNTKGHEAATYIKKQMEDERDSIIKQANKDADKEMLGEVRKFAADIRAMRESGRGVSHAQLRSRIKSLLGKTKKTKLRSKRRLTKDYQQKYKNEIDKLRQDRSMYTYWDNKKRKEQ